MTKHNINEILNSHSREYVKEFNNHQDEEKSLNELLRIHKTTKSKLEQAFRACVPETFKTDNLEKSWKDERELSIYRTGYNQALSQMHANITELFGGKDG